ncbi:MAG: endonuclease [Flavobacteriaceae bacterium]|nr:MAG: endonuclease [Flavobacteriaceae bacterium]
MKKYFVYILSNKNRTVLYIGYTSNIDRRLMEHKKANGTNFTKKYNVVDLVYLETFEDMTVAKKREKQLKNWYKEWKWNLIKELNPTLKNIELN